MKPLNVEEIKLLVNDLQLLAGSRRSEEHTSELQSQSNLVCRLLLEKKKNKKYHAHRYRVLDARGVNLSSAYHLLPPCFKDRPSMSYLTCAYHEPLRSALCLYLMTPS